MSTCEYTQQYHYDISQSDILLNETDTKKLPNDKTVTKQGPTNNERKMESQTVCTMGMPTNDGNISTTTMIEVHKAEERVTRSSCMPEPSTQVT